MEDNIEEVYCTNCKRNISAVNYALHEPHCRRNIVLCKVCEEPVPRSQIEEHFEENHVEISCQLCRKRMQKDHLETHMEEECPEREVNCPYCDTVIKAHQRDEHVNMCGSRTDVCDKCLRRFMLKHLEDHVKNCNTQSADVPAASPIESRRNNTSPPPPPYGFALPTPNLGDLPAALPTALPIALPMAPPNFQRPVALDDGRLPVRGIHGTGLPFNPLVPPPVDRDSPQEDDDDDDEDERPPNNRTIVVDPQWVGSIAEAMGVDESELDRIVAGNIDAFQQISQNNVRRREERVELQEHEEDLSLHHQLNPLPQIAMLNTPHVPHPLPNERAGPFIEEVDPEQEEVENDLPIAQQLQQELDHHASISTADTYLAQHMQYKLDSDDAIVNHDISAAQRLQHELDNDVRAVERDSIVAKRLQHELEFNDRLADHDTSVAEQLQRELNTPTEPPTTPMFVPHPDIDDNNEQSSAMLLEQLQAEEQYRIGGMPTMMLYNRAKEVAVEETAKQRQLKADHEFAQQLQMQSETPPSYAHQNSTHSQISHSPSPRSLSPYREEQSVSPHPSPADDSIPCDLCGNSVPFSQYHEHMLKMHPQFSDLIQFQHHSGHTNQDNNTHGHGISSHGNSAHGIGSHGSSTHGNSAHDNILGQRKGSNRYSLDLSGEEEIATPPDVMSPVSDAKTACQYCFKMFLQSVIHEHEMSCGDNPDAKLSKAYKQERNIHVTDAVDTIPCEFCNQLIHYEDYQVHQEDCPERFRNKYRHNVLRPAVLMPSLGTATRDDRSDGFPCEYCGKAFSGAEIYKHEVLCQHKLRKTNTSPDSTGNPVPVPRPLKLPEVPVVESSTHDPYPTTPADNPFGHDTSPTYPSRNFYPKPRMNQDIGSPLSPAGGQYELGSASIGSGIPNGANSMQFQKQRSDSYAHEQEYSHSNYQWKERPRFEGNSHQWKRELSFENEKQEPARISGDRPRDYHSKDSFSGTERPKNREQLIGIVPQEKSRSYNYRQSAARNSGAVQQEYGLVIEDSDKNVHSNHSSRRGMNKKQHSADDASDRHYHPTRRDGNYRGGGFGGHGNTSGDRHDYGRTNNSTRGSNNRGFTHGSSRGQGASDRGQSAYSRGSNSRGGRPPSSIM